MNLYQFLLNWMLNWIQKISLLLVLPFLSSSIQNFANKILCFYNFSLLYLCLVANQNLNPLSRPLSFILFIMENLFLTVLSIIFVKRAVGEAVSPCLLLFLSLQMLWTVTWKAYLTVYNWSLFWPELMRNCRISDQHSVDWIQAHLSLALPIFVLNMSTQRRDVRPFLMALGRRYMTDPHSHSNSSYGFPLTIYLELLAKPKTRILVLHSWTILPYAIHSLYASP